MQLHQLNQLITKHVSMFEIATTDYKTQALHEIATTDYKTQALHLCWTLLFILKCTINYSPILVVLRWNWVIIPND